MEFKIDKNTDLEKLCNNLANPIIEVIFTEINKILDKSKNEKSIDVNIDVHVNISKVKK